MLVDIHATLEIFFNVSLYMHLFKCFSADDFLKIQFLDIYTDLRSWMYNLFKYKSIDQIFWGMIDERRLFIRFISFLYPNTSYYVGKFPLMYVSSLVKWLQRLSCLIPTLDCWEGHETPDWVIMRHLAMPIMHKRWGCSRGGDDQCYFIIWIFGSTIHKDSAISLAF